MSPLLAIIRFENVDRVWLWSIGAVLGAVILFTTYRGIFQRSERGLSWVLMCLRGVGLIALFLALAKPTWTFENDLVDAGQMAVVVDNSLSMSLVHGNKPRYDLAKEAAGKIQKSLSGSKGGPALNVELFDIQGRRGELPAQPTAESTDLVRAISESAKQMKSRYLTGIILISDGVDTTGRQQFGELVDLNVPVHTVGYAPPPESDLMDLALRRPRGPERALVNNEIKVSVPVVKTGGPAVEATVAIKLGGEPVTTKKVSLPAGSSEQTVSLSMTPAKPGSFVYTINVESPVGERTLANNQQHFPLRVDKEPIRVLYLEGFLRYEYKFLKSRLEDDPDVGLVSHVRRPNPELGGPKAGRPPLTAEALKNFDVVILGDMEGSYLAANEYQALLKWLDEKGHALLVLGGYHSFGPEGFRGTPLAEALPVVFADKPPYQYEAPFRPELTEEGRRHPVLEVAADRVEGEKIWGRSPPLLGACIVQRAKPGATVLAVNPNPNAAVEGQPGVVLAVQRFGAGHTMVLTADTTWRWSRVPRIRGQADTVYARFWGQTVRWLAGRSTKDDRPLLAVNTDRPDYDVAKPVQVRVTRTPTAERDLSTTQTEVDVTGPSGKPVRLEVQASSAEPDVFTGKFYPDAGGRYQVAAVLRGKEGETVANQVTEFLVHGSALELENPGTNPETLKTIAARTGGRYVEIEQIDQLTEQVTRKERRIARERKLELWNSPILFLIFLGGVATEWFIRRRNHLV
jgi:uncharacterized membrane protein